VNVSRPTKWGNPYRVFAGKVGGSVVKAKRLDNGEYVLMSSHSSRDSAFEHLLDLYRMWVSRAPLVWDIPDLAGKDLACWCPLDQPCHADVLLDIANPGAQP
jgi:hypothetical protein